MMGGDLSLSELSEELASSGIMGMMGGNKEPKEVNQQLNLDFAQLDGGSLGMDLSELDESLKASNHKNNMRSIEGSYSGVESSEVQKLENKITL